MASDNAFYENILRTRVCGLCFDNKKILLIKHNLNGKIFYAPPGGAVEFGESMQEALKRELKEETNLIVGSTNLKFITEYVNPPLHAIEIFYHIETWQGKIKLGYDPESKNEKIIESAGFYSNKDLTQINRGELHHILLECDNPIDLLELSGFINPPIKK